MARTFSRALGVPSLGGFLHAPSRRVYRTVQWADGVNLQRTETGGANLLERRMDFAIGSGAHSRTYVHPAAGGRLIELPVSWYSAGAGPWAMSPRYHRPHHPHLPRDASATALFCH